MSGKDQANDEKSSGKKPSRRKPPLMPRDPRWRFLIWYLPIVILLLWIWQNAFEGMAVRTIPYSEFKSHLARGEVKECEIRQDEINGRIVPADSKGETNGSKGDSGKKEKSIAGGKADSGVPHKQKEIAGKPANSSKPGPESDAGKDKGFIFRTVRVEDPKLVDQLEKAGVKFVGVRPGFLSQIFFAWIIPIGILVLLWIFLSRKIGAAGQAVMSVGKSRAKLFADKDTGVTFEDVAGCEEGKFELQEVVEFLRKPERYAALGAKIPKGVLLVGPPGTGKTLLARAVAGEAKVPFFSLSGSDFVEMFVGVGASRVRDLFQQATKHAPCIVFIDEIDAIGRQRGVHVGAVNDEREQTLNQLLVEMDGFEANVGVILLAATNRPDVLDRALLRPGRFDRQVVVDAPHRDGREAILRVHARGKPLARDVDFGRVAQATPGFSGADLANAVNEAALLAARRHSREITQKDLEEAVEKVVAGPERKSRRLDEGEKRRVAYHEIGHALVAAHSKHADPVHKISIVPRGRAALGYTLQLPEDDQFLLTRSELFDRLKGLLGGRAAEELVFHEVSTGAENDLEKATALAQQMVCAFGMSESIGLAHYAQRDGLYSRGGMFPGIERKPACSERKAEEIDQEVKNILDDAHSEARTILTQHRDQLERLAEALLASETLDAAAFRKLLQIPAESPGEGRSSDRLAVQGRTA